MFCGKVVRHVKECSTVHDYTLSLIPCKTLPEYFLGNAVQTSIIGILSLIQNNNESLAICICHPPTTIDHIGYIPQTQGWFL